MKTPRYYCPKTVEEAAAILASEGPGAYPLAGGTDVVVKLRLGALHPAVLVDLARLPLDGIVNAGDSVVLGARVTMTQLRTDPLIRSRFAVLAEAAERLGSPQIQNRATLGGNLGNASPAADAVCALFALDARVLLRSPCGARAVPVAELMRGPGQTALAPGELIEAITLPVPPSGGEVRQTYRKVGGRNAMVCSLSGVAGWTRIQDGVIVETRLALGAVGPTCLRAARAEKIATGARPDEDLARTAAAAAAGEASPIDDHRASAEHRRRVTAALVREHLMECAR
jgi:CO/xanthine dehydrogenase FAD-binding subunit